MIRRIASLKFKYELLIMAILMVCSFYITLHFLIILKTNLFFTHFLYIPIVLSCIWWKRKGLIVPVILSCFVIISQEKLMPAGMMSGDYSRILMFMVVAAITILLSEAIVRTQQDLKESKEKYSSLVGQANDGVIFLKNGIIEYANNAFLKIVDFTTKEVIGMKLVDFIVPADQEKANINTQKGNEKPDINSVHEVKLRRKDGTSRFVELSIGPITCDNGVASMTIIRDTSQKKAMEEQAKQQQQQLIQASKMVTLGTLMSGVAHEINNPNNCIKFNLSILERSWKDILPLLEEYFRENGDFLLSGMPFTDMRRDIPKLLSGIRESSDRIKNIVGSLKSFSRKDTSGLNRLININAVIRSSIELFNSQIKKSTDNFLFEGTENIPRVRGNFQQLEQVVVNLIENSCHALPERTRSIKIQTTHEKEPDRVVIRVADKGHGISAEHMKSIFDPFFTTKRTTGGTGLGLSISYNIVHDHGGEILFNSEVNRGTVATITLPATKEV